jgi:hypothetical protein
MTRLAFVTVADRSCFPGTLATVNSVLEMHPDADVRVVVRPGSPLRRAQERCLRTSDRVTVTVAAPPTPCGEVSGAAIRACACIDAFDGHDVVAAIEPGCLLCADVEDVAERCRESGGLLAGPVPAGVAAQLVFAATTSRSRETLMSWAASPGAAGPGRAPDIASPDDGTWGQCSRQCDAVIDYREGRFVNVSAGASRQRSFCCGPEVFWAAAHSRRVVDRGALQAYSYVWFLAMLWFGRCGDWAVDPFAILPRSSRHLLADLVHFLPQIEQVLPRARYRWNALSDAMIDRALAGIPRILRLGGGGMSEIIRLVAAHPWIRRYVEVGSFEGGSILTLGLRFLNRDIDFYSVESFTGSLDGTMDGFPLPSRRNFVEHLARFPGLRVTLVPGDSVHAAALFDDGSLDCAFIDARHDTPSVLRDIAAWTPKLVPGGLVAGDDYGLDSVYAAVHATFPAVNVTPSGTVWWVRLQGQAPRAVAGRGA